MKKILSFALVFAIALCMISMWTFAADTTAGEELKAMGLLKGDENGDLNEELDLTRAEMIVILARMNGVEEEAKSYNLTPGFDDSKEHWAENYVAYAKAREWTYGTTVATFEPDKGLGLLEAATYLLRVLKYDDTAGDFTFEGAVDKAVEIGFMEEGLDELLNIKRGDLFIAIKKTLNIVPNGEVKKLGEILGIIGSISEIDMKDADALSHIVVEVALNSDADMVSAVDFSIEDIGGSALVVHSADLVDDRTVWVETEPQVAGKLYTVTVAGKEATFTGGAKDKLLPEIESDSVVKDNVTIEVKFSKKMDRRNALRVGNYSVDKGLELISAEFGKDTSGDDDYTEVIIATSSQHTGTLYELTVGKGVTDVYGNLVDTESGNNKFKFAGFLVDKNPPRLQNLEAVNANKILIYFDEDSDLTAAAAEDIRNYTIINRSNPSETVIVEKAELFKNGDSNYTTVNLWTSTQTFGDTYELRIVNVVDKFGNVISGMLIKAFVGQPADVTGPEVKIAAGVSNDIVEIEFDEELDEAAAEIVGNYSINNNLSVVKAELKEDSEDLKTIVVLTTTAQKQSVVYRVTVRNVTDEFGNVVGSENDAYFSGVGMLEGSPEIAKAYVEIEDNKTFVYVAFDREMNFNTAETASNYFFSDGIGYGISVEQDDESRSTFKVRVSDLDDDVNYTLTVSGVTDASGNLIDSDGDTVTFSGEAISDDTDPEIISAVTLDRRTVKVIFNRKMAGNIDVVKTAGEVDEHYYANNPANYILIDKDSGLSDSARQIKAKTALMEEGYETVILNLSSDLTSGHTYDLYANATKVTSSSDSTLISDDHDDSLVNSYFTGIGIRSETDLPLNANNAEFLVGGTSSAANPLQITSIYSTSNETVRVKFNKDIILAGTFSANFANKESGGVDVAAGNIAIDSNDGSLLLVRTETGKKFVKGDQFVLTIYSGVSDKVTGKAITSENDYNKSGRFYSSTQSVLEPAIAEVVSLEDGKLQVTFIRDMHEDIIGHGIFNIADENGHEAVINQEFKSGHKNIVYVYIDDTNLEKGKIYILKIDNILMKDVLGFIPDEDEEFDFSIY